MWIALRVTATAMQDVVLDRCAYVVAVYLSRLANIQTFVSDERLVGRTFVGASAAVARVIACTFSGTVPAVVGITGNINAFISASRFIFETDFETFVLDADEAIGTLCDALRIGADFAIVAFFVAATAVGGIVCGVHTGVTALGFVVRADDHAFAVHEFKSRRALDAIRTDAAHTGLVGCTLGRTVSAMERVRFGVET